MTACRLIVHADDFGLTPQVNAGIVQAHRQGLVTSTSLMATGRAFAEAVGLARELPSLDLGVHLSLVEETPVLPAGRVASLIADNGRFVAGAGAFLRRLLRGGIDLRQVRAELEAQIAMVVDQGLPVSHLDGHQHLHVLPGVAAIVVELAGRFGIPAVRLPRERLRGDMFKPPVNAVRLAQMLVLHGFCRGTALRRLRTPDYFLGFYDGGHLSPPRLRALLSHLPEGKICELMCHPGLADRSPDYGHWRYDHAGELAALCDPAIRDWLARRGVTLISYQELLN